MEIVETAPTACSTWTTSTWRPWSTTASRTSASPSPSTDDNGNGAWDDGEAFIDVNGNGEWDEDMGEAGLGGGGAVVVYRLTYPWGVVTPILQQASAAPSRTSPASRVRNEPFWRRACAPCSPASACDRGVSAMEFALILPILVMFSAGTIEYSRLILLTQKLQSGAFMLADLTARDKTLATEQLDNIFLAIDQVVRPFEFAGDGQAIVTSLGADEDDDADRQLAVRRRRRRSRRKATSSKTAEVIELPGDITLASGETVIAAEVFYDFEPLFGVGLAPRTIHRFAFYKPRLGELIDRLPGA